MVVVQVHAIQAIVYSSQTIQLWQRQRQRQRQRDRDRQTERQTDRQTESMTKRLKAVPWWRRWKAWVHPTARRPCWSSLVVRGRSEVDCQALHQRGHSSLSYITCYIHRVSKTSPYFFNNSVRRQPILISFGSPRKRATNVCNFVHLALKL